MRGHAHVEPVHVEPVSHVGTPNQIDAERNKQPLAALTLCFLGLHFGNWLLRMGGRQTIPLTYVENCAAAVGQAGLVDAADGQTINIVDDNLPNGREIIRRYRRSGRKLRVIGIPQFALGWLARTNEWYSRRTEDHIPKVLTLHRVWAMWKPLRYSNERAKTLLGWKPEIDLNTAFQRTLSLEGRS